MIKKWFVVDDEENVISEHTFKWLAERASGENRVMHIDDYAAKYGPWLIIRSYGINISVFSHHMTQTDAKQALEALSTDVFYTYEVMSISVWKGKQIRVALI
jgi:hypothetical protein